MKINVLIGFLKFFKERSFVKASQLHQKDSYSNDDKDEIPKLSHGSSLLARSCIARVICLSNQETSWLENPAANMVAEMLR